MNVCYRGKYMHFVNETSLRMTHFKSNMFEKILLWNRTWDSSPDSFWLLILSLSCCTVEAEIK